MGIPFTPERLEKIRRMRKARRLFKKMPLFAYTYMVESDPHYTYEQFLADLRLRKKTKKKDKIDRSSRYGRYGKMKEFYSLYDQTGDLKYAIQAQRLKDNMAKYYRVQIIVNRRITEYSFSPFIPYSQIESLSKLLSTCKTQEEADKMVTEFNRTAHIL